MIKYTFGLYLSSAQVPGWECLLTKEVYWYNCTNGTHVALEKTNQPGFVSEGGAAGTMRKSGLFFTSGLVEKHVFQSWFIACRQVDLDWKRAAGLLKQLDPSQEKAGEKSPCSEKETHDRQSQPDQEYLCF